MIDTIDASPLSVPNDFDELYISEKEHNHYMFDTFLEFILYLTGADIESYRRMLMTVTGCNEKDLLQFVIDRKMETIRTFIGHRKDSHKVWSESAFGMYTGSSGGHCFAPKAGESVRNLGEVYHFVYKKEYNNLRLFEKAITSNAETAVRTLLEGAIEHQCRHIMCLDARLSCSNNNDITSVNQFNTVITDGQCTLPIRCH